MYVKDAQLLFHLVFQLTGIDINANSFFFFFFPEETYRDKSLGKAKNKRIVEHKGDEQV